jgi:hypothetical protein
LSDDLIGIIGCSILGLIAQGAPRQQWLEWVLRVTYGLFLFGEVINLMTSPAVSPESPWSYAILFGTTLTTCLLLFKPGRKLFSLIFSLVEQVVAGRIILAALGKLQVPIVVVGQPAPGPEADGEKKPGEPAPAVTGAAASFRKVTFFESFLAERVFVPDSLPHMNALFLYVTCLAVYLAHTELSGFKMPYMMMPIPVTFDQLFNYNFLGLIIMAFCGAGIFVSRKPMEALRRLGLVKPTFTQVLLGVAGIFLTFAYDYLWSTFTHSQEGLGYAGKLTHFNEGSFTPGAAPLPAFFIASSTGICAGVGEEILTRGGLQPVMGLLPAAFMHGVLHAQFAHAPLLIVQVFGWSTLMGILRRYTNTTTTIITHVGFNFLSVFLIAFNP